MDDGPGQGRMDWHCLAVVMKSFSKTQGKQRDYVRKAGDGKVCGPLAAAFDGLEVHVSSPCFYYRYRSISCFDGAVSTYIALYIFKTIIFGAELSLPIQAVLLQSHMRTRTAGQVAIYLVARGSPPRLPRPRTRTRAPVLAAPKEGAAKAAP